MSTRPEPLKLGPFSGGLNLLAEPQNIDNSELTECINYEVDIDGSLMNRPAIIETTDNGSNGTGRWKPIGRANFSAGGNYIIAANNGNGGISAYDIDNEVWTWISSTESECALQYNDIIYIIATDSSAVNGGRWDGTTFTSDGTMPRGGAAVFHKSRLFIVPGPDDTTNTSRLSFSDTITTSVLTWPATNIIDIAPGDGEHLNDIMIYNDNLVLFKDNSIYLLAYDIAPADAVLRKIHGSIGVSTMNSVDAYDNSIFFLHKGKVWEMQNYEFVNVNLKVPFVYDTAYAGSHNAPGDVREPVWLRRVGDRLLVGFFAKRYAYNLRTKTWSEWKSQGKWAGSFGPPMDGRIAESSNTPIKYYMGTVFSDIDSFFYVTNTYEPGTQDHLIIEEDGSGKLPRDVAIQCTITTKNLDFDLPFIWKRLTWWGMHALTGTLIEAKTIINNSTQSNDTWENISLHAWDDLTGTWDNVLQQFTVTTNVVGSALNGSKFYRFPKSLRFRTIRFKISIENDATLLEGPLRLFTLTASVGAKQLVGEDEN